MPIEAIKKIESHTQPPPPSMPEELHSLLNASGYAPLAPSAIRASGVDAPVEAMTCDEYLGALADAAGEVGAASLAAAVSRSLGWTLKETPKQLKQCVRKWNARVKVTRELARAGEEDAPVLPFPVYMATASRMPLGAILEEICGFIRKCVTLSEEEAVATTLWCAGTWGVRQGVSPGREADAEVGPNVFPRLHIRSGAPGSGKTTLLDAIGCAAARPLKSDAMSQSAFFRVIESHQPSLLLDESDAWLRNNEGMRGLINSGHRRNGVTMLSVKTDGEEWEPRPFRTFCPVALAGLGTLPATVEDRSIPITLKKSPGRVADRVRAADMSAFANRVGPHLAGWSEELAEVMAEGIESWRLPARLSARAMDNWEPLLCVADLAGGDWPLRAECALEAVGLAHAADRAPTRPEQLLADLQAFWRDWIKDRRAQQTRQRKSGVTDVFPMRSGEIADALGYPIWLLPTERFRDWLDREKVESWTTTADHGRPVTSRAIADTMRPFGVKPLRVSRRSEDSRVSKIRGYDVRQLRPLWKVHVPRGEQPQT